MNAADEMYAAQRERYAAQLLALRGVPYEQAVRMTGGTEGSGLVCLALSAALGTPVRLSARELCGAYFTLPCSGAAAGRICALFVFARSSSGQRARCVCTAGLVSPLAVLSCLPPKTMLERLDTVLARWSRLGCAVQVRALDRSGLPFAQARACQCRGLHTVQLAGSRLYGAPEVRYA